MSDDERACYRDAVALLARREMSQQQLHQKLARRDYSPDTIAQTLTTLVEQGYQSDSRFAEAWSRQAVFQGKGPLRIRQQLREKGIDDSTADQALAELAEDWGALAAAVRERRFGALPKDYPARAKQMRFLQYRGFSPDHIQQALRGGNDEA